MNAFQNVVTWYFDEVKIEMKDDWVHVFSRLSFQFLLHQSIRIQRFERHSFVWLVSYAF